MPRSSAGARPSSSRPRASRRSRCLLRGEATEDMPMNTPLAEPESLGSRLDAMARENTLTRWAGAALFAAFAGFLGWHGLPSRSLVRTERLELRDRQGRTRAALALDRHDGTLHLTMYDPQGHERISLVAHPGGPHLGLRGPD